MFEYIPSMFRKVLIFLCLCWMVLSFHCSYTQSKKAEPAKVILSEQDKMNLRLDSFVKYWLYKPYVYGGHSEAGIDCSALTQLLHKSIFDIDIPRTAYQQYKASKKIPVNQMQTGDLVFFLSKISPSGWHVGLYLGDGKLFHSANRKSGVIIQDMTDDMIKHIHGVGRYILNH